MAEYHDINELRDGRREWVNVSKKNDFFDGIVDLLKGLYPDRAHFLYELLQNAEDVGATHVEFNLSKDSLTFVHNGSPFEYRHVEAITNIGNSTKLKENGCIGKFGIGFKSVFAFTNGPIIQSGEWRFKISDLVIPDDTDKDFDQTIRNNNQTYFRFPFDATEKPAAIAHRQIEEGLIDLEPESLLFLRHIKEVLITIGAKKSYVRKDSAEQTSGCFMVTLSKQLEGVGESHSYYLKFENTRKDFQLEIRNKDGSPNCIDLPYGISYKLERKSDGMPSEHNKLGDCFSIAEKSSRNTFSYFPAEKEDSHLRFCINAPFATTPDRASFIDSDDNSRVVELIVKLQCESMDFIKEQGLLTTEFLGILPNSKERLTGMYAGFTKRLTDYFR